MNERSQLHPKDALLDDVFEDVSAASRALEQADTLHSRRSYVRAAFAGIEALVSWLKYRALRLNPAGSGRLSTADLVLLQEEQYSIDSQGRSATQQRFIPIDQNLRFSLRLYFGPELVAKYVSYSGEDWPNFRSAIRLRNRLAHPKTSDDMRVSDEELQTVKRAFGWIASNMIRMLADLVEAERQRHGGSTDNEGGRAD